MTFSDVSADLLRRMPRWSREETALSREEEFNRFALALFGLQFENILPYQRLCRARHVSPAVVRDWREIPALPVAAFKDFDVTSLPPEDRTAVFLSSGTTGQVRSRHFHNRESLALYEASLLSGFHERFPLGKTPPLFVFLTPPPERVPSSSLAHMFGVIAREQGGADPVFAGRIGPDGAWNLDVEAAVASLSAAGRSGRPVWMMGTAFLFVHLLDACGGRGTRMRLPDGSRVLETGGYKGRSRSLPKEELYRLIHERLGIAPDHVHGEYGMSELGSQAYDDAASGAAGRVFRFPPWVRVRMISPETGCDAGEGETGLIRVFDLSNVRSVLAVQTEDLGRRRGDGFELLGRATAAEPRGCSLMTF